MNMSESREQHRPNIIVDKLWSDDTDNLHKYRFGISASRDELFIILNMIMQAAGGHNDGREIVDFLDGKQHQLNFGALRFYYDKAEGKIMALINGGASNPALNEREGRKLVRLLEAFTNENII